jgi:hypothetical protein
MMKNDGRVRPGSTSAGRRRPDGPSHPTIAAAVLMIVVTAALVAVALVGALSGG